jgi:predicted DsbA family dithiol-disulfide isomerase
MQVEIWSDVVCPWCYIGKRRFETALAQYEHADEVEVTWRSFELDPTAPHRSEQSLEELLAGKYGMSLDEARAANERVSAMAAAEGLDYQLHRASPTNTFDAHRLIQLAAAHGLQDAAQERLMRAYFCEGAALSDHDTLRALAAELGLPGDEVDTLLSSERHADLVRGDQELAQRMGVQGVPFFAIDRRFGVSGAQPVQQIIEALETARRHAREGADA